MFFRYLNDMKSWIFFFLVSLTATDILLLMDPGIGVELSALVYVNVLVLIMFIAFFIWRFRREMAYTRQLALLANEPATDWYEALPETRFKRDEMVNYVLHEAGISFSKQLSDIRRTNVAQGDYTAAWVHEVKAPLTAMRLIIESNRGDLAMRKIEAEWLRVYLLVDQQLYISRLPTLEADYVLESVVTKNLVSAEVRELMSWCREKNVAVELEGLHALVMTDVKWSRFIIRQILTNAVKYSREGGTIFITARSEPTGHVVLAIHDEGPGIPEHDLPRIFDKGFTGGTGRLHNAATGLGLYLAKTVSAKLGIMLSAQSDLGRGTTIEMAFPKENDFDKILT
ncbi:sensor histidine kinase [Bacillus solitudinis]|uniref:sensor histidine kinase n=1 Tax=Bacillus solitudinis TaxID=2014074 RepID=UPI001D0D50EC|nr:sensor histidine kinase [Bacillus solitudinis]